MAVTCVFANNARYIRWGEYLLDLYKREAYTVDMTTTEVLNMNATDDGWTVTDEYGHDVQLPGRFADVAAVKRANVEIGHHWFSRDTMRFFDCRLMTAGRVYFGRLFISSERQPWFDENGNREPRLYTIRCANDDGTISTIGEFGQYKTAAAAERAIFTQYGRNAGQS